MKPILLSCSTSLVRQAVCSLGLAAALAVSGCDKTGPGNQDLSTTPDDFSGPAPDLTGTPPDLTSPPPDLTGPLGSDMANPPRDMANPPGPDMANPPGPDMANPPPDMANPPGPDMANPTDMATPPVDMIKPPVDMVPPSDGIIVMPDGPPVDMATPDMVPPAPDMVTPPPPVTGTIITTFVTDPMEVNVPTDLSQIAISALIPGAMGTFTTVNGTGQANGTFSIPGIPVGTTYYLRIGTLFIITSARSLDLGSDVLGRTDIAEASQTTNLALSLTGLAPWVTGGNLLTMFSSNAAFYMGDVTGEAGGEPAANATTFMGTIDWSQLFNANLIDNNKGDKAFIAHITQAQSGNNVPVFPVTRGAQFANFAQVDGQATSTSAALTAPMNSTTVAVGWKRSQFEGYRTAVNPNAMSIPQIVYFVAQPGGLGKGSYSDTADLLLLQPDTNTTDFDSGTMTFANPYPAAWPVVGYAAASYTFSYKIGNTTALTIGGGLTYTASQADFTANFVKPIVSPARFPQINGMDAFANRSSVGVQPTLSWTAPDVGAPAGYVVQVFNLRAQAGATVRSRVASFTTRGTQIVLPPGLLMSGQSYYFQVSARAEAGVDLSAKPFRHGYPGGAADLFSGVFTP